jgi:hypothetical protein
MPDWSTARSVADELAERGVDPLDLDAARAARAGLRNRFVLDLLLIAGLCAVAMSLALVFLRAVRGQDPLGGNELWIGSAGLVLVLVSVALRSLMPGRAQAYELAWNEFVQRIWPGTGRGDDLGAARLDFVRRAGSGEPGEFPSAAPGRKS